MKPIDYDAALNDEQRAAVMAPDGPALVLAAAGTGKTRTLVYRVAHLVERGIPPERILLLTFTNRAAREMMERAAELVGSIIGGMWGGTFHHMANRILRRYGGLVGYRSDFTILDRDDTKSLVSQCLKDRKLGSREFPKPDVLLQLFGSVANTGNPIEEVIGERFQALDVDPQDVRAVHDGFETRKRELNAMDFDDLLSVCRRLFRESPQTLARYQEQFLHVLVDEYQDTNMVQAQLVDAVVSERRNLLVVGDDFQSIYSWRGADFRNILSFPERYPATNVFKLETNYRSAPEILDVANTCIAGNPEQFQKTLRATRPPHRKPRVVLLRDGEQQARYVINEILKLKRDGVRLADIAVLYRAHFHAMELQMALTGQNLPYVITSGVRFFEQAHVKDVCCFLRTLVYPGDELAFVRLLGLLPGAGPRTAEKIWKALGGTFHAADAGNRATVGRLLREGAREEWKRIEAVIASCAGQEPLAIGAAIEDFVEAFYAAYAEATFDNADRRLEDIQELANFTARFQTLEAFLSEVALLTNLDAEVEAAMRQDAEVDAIRLSTVHQAKGLEWRVVIVLWAVEGMFPSARTIAESSDGDAEERRLFYVAVTRAKDELYLCAPEVRRMRDGGVFFCQRSRYLQELDPGQVREVRAGYI